MPRLGVLALQGDFAEHVSVLRRLGSEAQEVRRPDELSDLDGLILPGGESTTITRLMDEYEFAEPLRRLAQDSFPVWGPCAGMIVLARRASDLDWPTLGALDITVRRNAFGRQVDSFETDLSVPSLGIAPFPAVFIRAPPVGRPVVLSPAPFVPPTCRFWPRSGRAGSCPLPVARLSPSATRRASG